MSVLNEMISEIKFIKFLASEDGWMKRAFDARAKELKLIRESTPPLPSFSRLVTYEYIFKVDTLMSCFLLFGTHAP